MAPRARVIAFGYGPLALASLATLERVGVTPAAVVVPGNRTGPDVDLVRAHVQFRGWTLLVQPPRRSLTPFLDTIRRLHPDLLLVWSYSMLLPPELIALARLGAVNVHGGLLPEYRGGHVMNWAIANGERETGVTLAYLDEGIDTGPVIAERRVPIAPADDAASVRGKLKEAGQALLEEWWPAIEAGTAPRVPQDESRARYHRLRTAEDGRIDWSASSAAIVNLVRALAPPWPGAFFVLGGRTMVVRGSLAVDGGAPAIAPGTIIRGDEAGVLVASGTGSVHLLAVEIDGQPAPWSELEKAGLIAGARLATTFTR
jgi:methionyl-tRNA formyltransferase